LVFAFNSFYSQGQQPRLLLLNNFCSNTINSCKINTELLFGLKNKILLQKTCYLSFFLAGQRLLKHIISGQQKL
jgi:hypothetical protein